MGVHPWYFHVITKSSLDWHTPLLSLKGRRESLFCIISSRVPPVSIKHHPYCSANSLSYNTRQHNRVIPYDFRFPIKVIEREYQRG